MVKMPSAHRVCGVDRFWPAGMRSSGRLHSTARPLRNDVGNTAGQGRPASANDYGSWRLFLINKTMGAIRQLSPALAGEAQSLGNPTVSFVTLPPPTPGVAGAPALVFTCFVFGANNGATRTGGTHLRLSSPVTKKSLCELSHILGRGGPV